MAHALQLYHAARIEEGPVVPRKCRSFGAFASCPRSVSLASTALNSQSDESLDESIAAHSPKAAFSDARVLTVADLPLVHECASDESCDEGSEVDDDSASDLMEGAEMAMPSPLGSNGAVAPGRVLMMRELPSLEEIMGMESDEEWLSQDERELLEDEGSSDADDEWD
jgi:hypothetical protein